MFQIPVAKLNDFFAAVAEQEELYLPVDNVAGQAEFKKWEKGDKLSTALNTVRSAKDFFFPQTENLMEFKMEGKNIDVVDAHADVRNFAVFGVRGCDAAAFHVLDTVFLVDPIDTYYKNRREHGVMITLACTEPAPTCFCNLFGTDATNPGGDITSWIVDEMMYLEAVTDKGKNFLEKYKACFEDAAQDANAKVDAQKSEVSKKLEALPFAHLKMDKFKGENLMELFNDPAWEKLSKACLGCGTCTFVCPTCQCYDIRDFDTGHGIKRFRCWDSCMYSDFTQMAHGNPRTTQLERFRQRFMHKLVYHPANHNGEYSCVGCGRCLAKCPISMNIVKVMKTLGKN